MRRKMDGSELARQEDLGSAGLGQGLRLSLWAKTRVASGLLVAVIGSAVFGPVGRTMVAVL